MTGRPLLSVVAIGLDEGPRLLACLRSILASGWPADEVIYVDSGSRDGSLEAAAALPGVRALALGDPRPNAAKGRNRGWREARGELVQFLDGDMILLPGWLEEAKAALDLHPEAGQVHGEVVERDQGNLFHRLFALDWEERSGPVSSSGGAALYRRRVLEALGGFDETLPAGEEPDLCWRIRNRLGLLIWKLPRPMAEHDLAMRTLRQWWRRAVKSGWAYAAVGSRYWRTADPFWRRELASICLMGSLFPLAAVLALSLRSWLPLALLAALLALLAARKTWQLRRRAGSCGLSLLYALNLYLGKLPLLVGVLRRWTGRSA